MRRHHERPLRRVNPGGAVRWVARYTDRYGHRSSVGTFDVRGPCKNPTPEGSPYGVECCAQHAIWAAYEAEHAAPRRPDTVGAFAATWTERRPRADRTNTSYNYRLGCVLDVKLEGRPFREYRMADVRRRHVAGLIDVLLTVQRRSRTGALGILWVLSAMWQDALEDEVAEVNPFVKASIRASDPRITKRARPVRVFSWEQMHGFASSAAGVRRGKRGVSGMDRWRAAYAEAMVRVLSDCGLRLGELLALYRSDLHDGMLEVRRTAWHGRLQDGTKTDHGEVSAGRVVPVPAALGVLLTGLPARLDTRLLFPAVRGGVWQESLFYREVWWPAQEACGLDMRPHELRHSYVSLLRAAGVDPADLADIAGHTVQTAFHYTHALGRSFDAVRGAVEG